MKSILAFIVIALIMYACGVFISNEINIMEWYGIGKVIYLLLLFKAAIYVYDNPPE
jgi:hypothetical protein